MKNLKLAGFFWLMLWFSVAGMAQELSVPQGVTVGKLKNGLTYYHIPNGDRGKVRLTMLSKIGALAEKPEEHGYAHILEHLMADGTKHFPGKTSVQEMDDMGMRRGREMSAFTSTNYTQYNLIIPAHHQEYFRRCLNLFKEWAFFLEPDSAMLENEKKVIIEEIRMGGKGSATAYFYDGTEMEGHDLLGDMNDVKAATVSSLTRFYKKFYRPEFLSIIVYGDISEQLVKKTIEEFFGPIPAPTEPLPQPYPEFGAGNRMAFGKAAGFSASPELILAVKKENIKIQSVEEFRQQLVYSVLGRIMEGRLRDRNSPSISSGKLMVTGSLPTIDFLSIVVKSAGQSLYKDQLNDLCRVLAQIVQHGFSQEEIDYFSSLHLDFLGRNKNSDQISLENVQNYFLSGNVPLSGAGRYALSGQLVKTLKSADFEAVIADFLKSDKLVHVDSTSTAYTADFTLPYVLARLRSIDTLKTEAFHFTTPKMPDLPAADAMLDFPEVTSKPSALADSYFIDKTLRVLKYSNGLTLVLNRNENEKVLFKVVGNGGLNLIPKADRAVFSTYKKYLNAGYANYSTKEIFNFERLEGISLSDEIKDTDFSYVLRGNSASFEKLCQVFHFSLVNPTKPTEAEFLKIQERVKRIAARQEKKEPEDSIDGPTDMALDAEMQNKLFTYRDQILRNLSGAILYISGDLPADAEALASRYVATIPVSQAPVPEHTNPEEKLVKGFSLKEIAWKRESSMVSFWFKRKMNRKTEVKDELILEAIGELVNIKMLDNLREKNGLVYSTGVTANVNKYPDERISLNVRYMVDSKNIPRSKELMLQTFADLKHGRIETVELERLKAILVSKYLTGFFDDQQMEDNWLKMNVKYASVFSWERLDKIIASISPQEIKKAMAELFDLENYALVYYLSPKG